MTGWRAAMMVLGMAGAAGMARGQTISLAVDLTDVPKKILHARETLAVKPGPLTLVYPKWIPGDHGPTGPIENMAGFFITANGAPVKWERDKVDMFAFHLTVPAGVTQLDIKLDFLATGPATGATATASTGPNLAMLDWNTLVVYPAGKTAAEVMVTPSVLVPSGWEFGTALEPQSESSGSTVQFKPVSLEQLVDSPVLAGRYFREVALAPEVSPKHFLDMAADGPESLQISPEHIENFSRLVRETGALYQSRHYGAYHFLVALSDQVAHFGVEHHQSSDDRLPANAFVDDDTFTLNADLLPHEFNHSWNGKYRRPAGLATPNYQVPMEGGLLWVYEGLTQYMGFVLATRSGLWTPEQYRGMLAVSAAGMDARPGRTWRDLQDTATMAQVLYVTDGAWDSWRRNTDFYDEGALIWLDVDTTIRTMTKGTKSLNDFLARFYGAGGNTAPKVLPYSFADVVAGLNAVVPNDWTAFLRTRLDSNGPRAPLDGLEHGGWRLTYTPEETQWGLLLTGDSGTVGVWYSLGLQLSSSGVLSDVLKDGVADKAGLGPGMHIVAVNGRGYTNALLKLAIHDAEGTGPGIELIVENAGFYKMVTIGYHGGERHPVLVRVPETPDLLSDILKPMAPPAN
jgi:predicted metalloprotease with PDZ domain